MGNNVSSLCRMQKTYVMAISYNTAGYLISSPKHPEMDQNVIGKT